MGDRVLEIVLHLMDHLRESHGEIDDMDLVFSDLKDLGYTENEISSAYCWVMDRFGGSENTYFSQFPAQHSSSRILTHFERLQMSPEAHGFMIRLLHHGLIDDEQFESVLERATLFSPKPVTLDQIKLVSTAVVFTDFTEFDPNGWFDHRNDRPRAVN